MLGSSFIHGLRLTGVAMLALASFSATGMAGGNHGEPPPVYEQNYSGPPIIRRIPGLRILFGDYVLTQDEYDQLYEKKKKKKQIDESYYEPKPAAPAKPKPLKPAAKVATATPAPASKSATAAVSNAALPQKTASAAVPKPTADGPLSCENATQVVSGYGFSSVEASACTGKLYVFKAKRGGKSFAIKLNAASGELTEVKKLP